MYRTIGDLLRRSIDSGEWPNGHQLPTEAMLCETYGLSRQTVRRALDQLVAEGLIYRVRGRGTFVSESAPRTPFSHTFGSVEDLIALSADTTFELISPVETRVSVEAAGRLRLDMDRVITLKFRRLYNGTPFCVTTVWLPPDVGAQIAERPEFNDSGALGTATVIGLIDASADEHSKIAWAQQSITAGVADNDMAELLLCQPGNPLLNLDRIYYNAQQRPVEIALSHFNADRYSYRIDLRRRGYPSQP